MSTTCRAVNVVGDATFRCTRERRHRGRHVARGVDGMIVRIWARTYLAATR